ncbi:hypothetical protein [Limnohabitans sp. Rim47]|uniref:hypothetical protein n=1 Tax=Limnohabitans sp. Rim47 TaxID=1100721 RepID=UPI0012DC396D|nr:hypothetical protein [Limnohabitans sp. Rim47]
MDDRAPPAAMPTLTELNAVLGHLRQAWPQKWPGLPLVFERAWQQLALGVPRTGSRAHALLAFGRSVAEQVERDGAQRHAQGQEPAYHNRLHIADTLVCMTYLLKASAYLKVPGARQAPVAALALAIMAGHDFLHPGGTNSQPSEFEARAVHDLRPLMQAAGLVESDQEQLSYCILATDPVRVKSFHLAVRSQVFDLRQRDCLAVLVQEADILASTMPQTQQGLTQALSREWTPTQPKAAEQLLLPQNRLLFLEHAALFSSPAARLLGMDEVKLQQVAQIKKQMLLQA